MARLGMLIDLRTCIGCHACSVACKVELDVPLGGGRDTVKYVESGTYPHAKRFFIPVLCNHCEDAPCLKACPAGAIVRLPDGEVVINEGDCNVNRFCQAACPYGAIYIDPESHMAQKCTFCEHRTAQGLAPACVDACPTRCRIFGDLDDPTSDIGRKVRDNPTSVWKPDAGTLPRVVYIDPSKALGHIADDGVQVDTRPRMAGDPATAQGLYTPPGGAAAMSHAVQPMLEAPWGPMIGVYFVLVGLATGITLLTRWVHPQDERTHGRYEWGTTWVAFLTLAWASILPRAALDGRWLCLSGADRCVHHTVSVLLAAIGGYDGTAFTMTVASSCSTPWSATWALPVGSAGRRSPPGTPGRSPRRNPYHHAPPPAV